MKKPKQYIQEKGLIHNVEKYCKGSKLLILLGNFNADVLMKNLNGSLCIPHEFLIFEKECTKQNILEIVKKMKNENFDIILGLGGGKIIDIAKAACFFYPCFLMVMPTVASMDGACSSISVLYEEDGQMDRYLYLNNNPDVVLVDTLIVFEAPFRMICAGMADALSTYFETKNYIVHHNVDREVLQLSKACLYNIIDNYNDVKKAYKNHRINPAVEKVIETILYESTVAFENSATTLAHAFANASTKIKESKGMHGERVALGLRLQLLLEENDWIVEFDRFLKVLDLPMHLEALNIHETEYLLLIQEMKHEEGMKWGLKNFNEEEILSCLKVLE